MAPQNIHNGRHSSLPLYTVLHCRVRDREPSRISFLSNAFIEMKSRKLRRKHTKMLKKSVHIKSVLHVIALNYKEWNIGFNKGKDSFYRKYLWPYLGKGDSGEFRKQRSNAFNRLRRKAWKRILYAFKQIFNAFKQPALLHFNIAFRMLESKLI